MIMCVYENGSLSVQYLLKKMNNYRLISKEQTEFVLEGLHDIFTCIFFKLFFSERKVFTFVLLRKL